jgi:hypothetical protein
VRPWFQRWQMYGLNSSSFDSRLTPASSSPALAARAYRCTVLRSRPVARRIAASGCPASSRSRISAWRSLVRLAVCRSRPHTSRDPSGMAGAS